LSKDSNAVLDFPVISSFRAFTRFISVDIGPANWIPSSPARRVLCAAYADATSVLVGIQPVLTHVPPKRPRSIMATRWSEADESVCTPGGGSVGKRGQLDPQHGRSFKLWCLFANPCRRIRQHSAPTTPRSWKPSRAIVRALRCIAPSMTNEACVLMALGYSMRTRRGVNCSTTRPCDSSARRNSSALRLHLPRQRQQQIRTNRRALFQYLALRRSHHSARLAAPSSHGRSRPPTQVPEFVVPASARK